VDAYAHDTFTGTVSQVRLQPTVTNNVVTYTVIIEAPNPDEKLFPGMTANIIIVTQSEEGVIIPLEALSCRLSPEVMKRLQIVGSRQSAAGSEQYLLPTENCLLLTDTGIVSVPVQTGLSDGVNVIVKTGIQQGDRVILSSVIGMKDVRNNAAANPLMPRPPGRR
jgi:HlyD family secretion protein